jgi:tRNA A-37 threonylcarbamoyl transferase component Bud32
MSSILATASEVASALLYLHSHGIVHGDLSAWNVLLTSSGAAAMQGGRGFIAKARPAVMARLCVLLRIRALRKSACCAPAVNS